MLPSPCTEFLLYLQEQGIPLGLSSHVAVTKLLAGWKGSDRAALRDALAALLARSQPELEQIKQLFDSFYAADASPVADLGSQPDMKAPPGDSPPPVPAPTGWGRQGKLAAWTIAGLLLIVTLWWGVHPVAPTQAPDLGHNSAVDFAGEPTGMMPPRPPLPSSPPPLAATLDGAPPPITLEPPDLATPPPDLASKPAAEPPRSAVEPTFQLQYSAPRAAFSLGAAFLLVFLALYRSRSERYHRRASRSWAASQLAEMPGPQHYQWRLQEIRSSLRRDEIDEFATLLHRLCAEPGSGHRLDVEGTIDRLARTGQLVTLSRYAQPMRRAIVMLIDYGHQAQIFLAKVHALINGIERRGVPVVRWYFDNDAARVSATPYGALQPLLTAIGADRDAPLVVVSYGADLDDPAAAMPSWVETLREFSRCAFLHPVLDPRAWPRRLQQGFTLPVWPLSRLGLVGTAFALAYDRAMRNSNRVDRSRLRSGAQVRPESIRGLLRLVALAPRPTVEVVELLRQRYYPDVPEHILLPLVEATASPGGTRLHISAPETARLLGELRQVDGKKEQQARWTLLHALASSEPSSGSAAHLRWRLDRALQELHLLADAQKTGAHDAGPRRAVRELIELSASPIFDEVADALRALRLPGERWLAAAHTVAVLTPLPRRARRQLTHARVPAAGLQRFGGSGWLRPDVRDIVVSLLAAMLVGLGLWATNVLRIETVAVEEPTAILNQPTEPEKSLPQTDLYPPDLALVQPGDLAAGSAQDLGARDPAPRDGGAAERPQTGRLHITLQSALITKTQVQVKGKPWNGSIVTLPIGSVAVSVNNPYFDYHKIVTIKAGQETILAIQPEPVYGILHIGVSPPAAELMIEPPATPKKVSKTQILAGVAHHVIISVAGDYPIRIALPKYRTSQFIASITAGKTWERMITLEPEHTPERSVDAGADGAAPANEHIDAMAATPPPKVNGTVAGIVCSGANCPCIPGVNCPCTPGVNCPCIPGFDCSCTKGQDCACEEEKNCVCTGPNCPCIPGLTCPCSIDPVTHISNCPVRKFRHRVVTFPFDSPRLRPEGETTLRVALYDLAQHLKNGGKIRIESHTDNIGNMEYATRLTQSQATSILYLLQRELPEYLIRLGADPELANTIQIGWYGFRCPIVPHSKRSGPSPRELALRDDENEPNRRVEINLFPDDGAIKCFVPLPPQQ